MPGENTYDVTDWPHGDPYDDLGEVINGIIADVKTRQTESHADGRGKPGAVIHIPPGDYRLRTQVLIDLSFLRIQGAGHGFTSSSIRFNVPEADWPGLHELWPGGSRVMVDIPAHQIQSQADGAAFRIARSGSPRISSVEFVDFCIDGLHFTAEHPDGAPGGNPENSYVNGKTGIFVETANDSVRITGMGFVYLEHALTIHHADALAIHDNFIAECGSCIELRGWGQASKITDNLIGAGPHGHSIYAEHHGGLLITANNVFPRGASSIHLHGVRRSSVTNNRLHSFYPGMVVLAADSSENLVASNHLLRDHEPWTPFLGIDNGLDDVFGLLSISGSNNTVIGNHVSEVVESGRIRPSGATPVIIRLVEGHGNLVSTNHVVAMDVTATASDSCFEAQVDALLSEESQPLDVIGVRVDPASTRNTILDSGRADQLVVDTAWNAVRPTPWVDDEPPTRASPNVQALRGGIR
ncbi:NosD domain-containing protein [Agromyces aurantiacus]|uniref:NosD domain-containing protein n=1 Tax=Agromyces aurantiacus TaxID=165814 RepID=A0ABV9R0H6_9MICO|nr:right-handed parallel beta-helix repeat-containing protein [Agromyces aurantiacus]MBM7505922.1 inulin fructotransferase (DFA-I-forming) [Agromyces aurantiacus]